MNMRRILKQPTLRMQSGGDLQIPQGPGLDRAGFLARNPGVVQNQAASPSPGQTPYEKDLALRNAQTSASSIVKDASQQAGAAQVKALTAPVQPAGWGREDRANSPAAPAPAAPSSWGGENRMAQRGVLPMSSASPTLRAGTPMAGNPGVFKHGTNSFSDSATAPVWSNTGKPSAQNSSLMAGLAAKHGSGAPAGWRGQNEGFGPAGTPQTNRYEGGFAPPIPSGMRDSLQQGFNSPSTGFGAQMKDGGDLRTGMGGHVPGSGSGDKIPAKYEPGEFVVSNDMLDKAPGLRDMLHNLRGEALADKGMTPEQADAKAVSGPTLRAQAGYGVEPYVNHVFGDNTVPAASGSRTVATTPYRPNFTMGGTPPTAPASDFDAGKYTKPSVDPTTGRYTHEDVRAGAGGGQTARTGASVGVGAPAAGVQGAGAGTGGGSGSGVSGAVRQGVGAQSGVLGKSGYLAGRVLASPVAQLAGKAVGAAGVISNFNDYKLNDPGVDSSAAGTWDALREGEFSKAGRSLRNGALEAGMDLGSYAANTADLLVPGTGPSRAYNTMLRNKFGDRLVDNSGNAASAPAAASAPREQPRSPGQDVTTPGQDPGRAAAAQTSAPAVDWTARKSERDALTLRDAALGNQMQAAREASDAAGYAAQDRQQAVNQRLADSFEDSKRRRSAEVTLSSIDAGKNSMVRKQAAMKDLEGLDARRLQVGKDDAAQRVATANNDASLRSAGMTNATTREGNRLNYDASVSNSLRTNESNKLRLQFDMGKDKRDFDEAKSNKAFDQTIQGTEALHKKVLNSLPFVKGDKGPEPDAAGAAAYMNGANAAVARRANELRKAGRVAEAAQLEDQGVANISASDHQNLVDGIEMMKRFSEKNSEWFTSGTSGKMSNNPLDFLVVGPDPKNPKKVLLAGGQTMDMDDVAGMKLANRFGLPQTGNPQTDRFLPK